MKDTAAGSRTRTVAWADPQIGALAATRMSGRAYLDAIVRGDYPPPPIAQLLGFTLTEVADGRAVFEVEPAEYHYNPIGVVHGGLLFTLCDSAMGCAVHTTLPEGVGYTTVEAKVNFIRPLTTDIGCVSCEGKTITVGSRLATAEARVTDSQGRLYAHATTTCMIFRP